MEITAAELKTTMKDWIKDLATTKFGKGNYSQSYQDELLAIIFKNIGTVNATPFCVEFGFNSMSLTKGSGANTAQLTLEGKWDSLLLDGDFENPEINLHKHWLLSSTICDVFAKYDVPKEPEYVSIDVDSTDLWLFDAMLEQYRPMVTSVEYNSNFPLEYAITFPNDPEQRCDGDRGFGASLKALNMVAEKHGYSLLWVVPKFDLFFIRNDLVEDGTDSPVYPLEKWRSCTGISHHQSLKKREKARVFVDYEVFTRTGGDLEQSQQAAYPVCEKFLNDSLGQRLTRLKRKVLPGA